jgi:hypothetical protein
MKKKNVFNIVLPPRVKATDVIHIPKSLVEAVTQQETEKACILADKIKQIVDSIHVCETPDPSCVRCIAESYRKPK